MADSPLWTCHCYGRGIHLHRDATSITADFNMLLLCPPSFNVPILLLWVVITYIQLTYAVSTTSVSNMQIYLTPKCCYWWTCSTGCKFFLNTYPAYTLSVRIHTLSLSYECTKCMVLHLNKYYTIYCQSWQSLTVYQIKSVVIYK